MIYVRTALLVSIVVCGLGVSALGQSTAGKSQSTASKSRSTAGKSRLVRMLTGRSETVRLNSVFKLRHDRKRLTDSLDELIEAIRIQAESLVDAELPPSMAELIYLVGSIDRSESEDALVQLLDSPNADIAMIAADALGRNQFYGAIDDLGRQVQRGAYTDRYAFRFNLVRSLAQMKHPDAIELMSVLETKLDGQLRFELSKILAEVTLDDFRGDTERYEAWENRSSGGGVFKSAGFSPPNSPGYDKIQFDQPQYYGIDIRAQRVMFVIDHSGSMKAPTSSGSRLMRAKHELVRAVSELPEDAEFAIVSFDSNVRHWREELSRATEENKRAAILYVQRLGFGNDTNTYGALRRALDFDDSLEAVFLLTDGKPTAGEIINPARLAGDIIHRNRWRHLNINTIGISVGGATESFLRSLAANSGGEFRAEQ